MTNNYSVLTDQVEYPETASAHRPRKSTINFIRQFSRSYVAIAGISISPLICN